MKKLNLENAELIGGYCVIARYPPNWYLYHCFQINRKKVWRKIPVTKYSIFGFSPNMPVAEAKFRCRQLNKERNLLKKKIKVENHKDPKLVSQDASLFPPDALSAFHELLENENFGSERHLRKKFGHFKFIQSMFIELQLLPAQYKENSKRIYKYFIRKKISVSYSATLVSLLNQWGRFISKRSGIFYDPVPTPRGREQSAIADAQSTKSGTSTKLGVRTASLPLNPSKLLGVKHSFSEPQYNWMYLSLWLGLRPNEVDLLHESKKYRVIKHKTKDVHIVEVYQSKLLSISEDKRWKRIPIIFPEQQKCLELIASQEFRRPLPKTMSKYLGDGYSLYAGRKGFVDMMLSKGQTLENISSWLGHRDIRTTWKHYKDRMEVNFTTTPETILNKPLKENCPQYAPLRVET